MQYNREKVERVFEEYEPLGAFQMHAHHDGRHYYCALGALLHAAGQFGIIGDDNIRNVLQAHYGISSVLDPICITVTNDDVVAHRGEAVLRMLDTFPDGGFPDDSKWEPSDDFQAQATETDSDSA